MRLTHLVAEIVHTFLRHLRLVNDEGVLQIPTLDKTYAQQRFYLLDEAERTGRSYLFRIVRKILERRMLLAQQVRLKSNRHIYLVMVARLDTHAGTMLGDILDGFAHHIYLLLRILFLQSHAHYLAHEITGTAIQNRHLRCIDIDDTVIDA